MSGASEQAGLPRQRSAKGQAAIYAVGLAFAKGTGLILLPLITHFLPPEEYARLELFASLIAAGALITSTWMVETLFRFAAAPAEEGDRAAANIAGLALVIGVLVLVAMALAAPLIATSLPLRASVLEVTLASAVIAAEAANAVPLGWLRMKGRARAWVFLLIGRTVLHLGLVGVFLTLGYGVAGVLAASVIASTTLGAVLLAVQWREGGLRFSPRAWRAPIVYGAPLTVNGLALFAFSTADLWFLAGHVPSHALGLYALGAKMALIAGMAMQPFDLWWYPRRLMVIREANGAARSARLAGFGAALALLCAAGASVVGPVLILALTPPPYHGAIALVPWMAGAIAIQALGNMVNVGCYLGRSGALAAAVNLGAAAGLLLLFIVLIPRFGLYGAIASLLLAQTLRTLAFGVLSFRRAPLPYPFARIAAVALACMATAALPQVTGGPLTGPLIGALGFTVCLLLAARLGLTPSGQAMFLPRSRR